MRISIAIVWLSLLLAGALSIRPRQILCDMLGCDPFSRADVVAGEIGVAGLHLGMNYGEIEKAAASAGWQLCAGVAPGGKSGKWYPVGNSNPNGDSALECDLMSSRGKPLGVHVEINAAKIIDKIQVQSVAAYFGNTADDMVRNHVTGVTRELLTAYSDQLRNSALGKPDRIDLVHSGGFGSDENDYYDSRGIVLEITRAKDEKPQVFLTMIDLVSKDWLASEAVASPSRHLILRTLDAHSGTPMSHEHFVIWLGELTGSQSFKNGMATRFMPEFETGEDGEVKVPLRATDSDVSISTFGDIPCEPMAPMEAALDFNTTEILTRGVVADNVCGNARVKPEPGVLVIFMRKRRWWERGELQTSGLPRALGDSAASALH